MEFGVFGNLDSLGYIFGEMGWFVGAFIVATLWTAYLSVIADIKFIYRLISIPTWLLFTIGMFVTIDNFAGSAYPGVPPKAQVVSFRVIGSPSKGTAVLEAWMYLTNQSKTKLYRFPHTQTKEEALRKALDGRKSGARVEVDLNEEIQKEIGTKITAGEMLDYGITHQGLPAKSGDENDSKIEPEENIGPTTSSDKVMIQLPDGNQIELKKGTTITLSPNGEIEIGTPDIKHGKPRTPPPVIRRGM